MVYRKDWGQPQQGIQGWARNMKAFGRKCNIAVADINTINNVVGLFVIPGGFMITSMIGPAVPAFGTSLTFSLGDPGLANRYLSASNIGAAGGALPAMAAAGLFFRTFTDTEIQLTVTAAATAAQAAGVLELYFLGIAV